RARGPRGRSPRADGGRRAHPGLGDDCLARRGRLRRVAAPERPRRVGARVVSLPLSDLGAWPMGGFGGRRRIYSLTADPDHTVVMPSRLRATGDPRLVLLVRGPERGAAQGLVRGPPT